MAMGFLTCKREKNARDGFIGWDKNGGPEVPPAVVASRQKSLTVDINYQITCSMLVAGLFGAVQQEWLTFTGKRWKS